MTLRTMIVLFMIGLTNVSAQVAENHKKFIDQLYTECLTNGTTYPLLKELCERFPKRLSGSKGLTGAIKWTKEVMESYGFDNVYLQEVMVPNWRRGNPERAYYIDSDNNKVELAILALGRSIATPNNGLSAQVVIVNSLDEVAKLGSDKITGKIVFYNRPFDHSTINSFSGYSSTVDQRTKGASQAARYGAVAAVIRSVSSAQDDHPHTGTLSYAKDAAHIPAAALGFKSADKLVQALTENPPLELYLKINSQTLPDVLSYNVIGEIKGRINPDSIIMVGGHLDAWDTGHGAHDDGAGTMHAVSAVRTLQNLGYKPNNTLRVVLFTNEENGLRGGQTYADSAVQQQDKHILAIESDAGGFTPRGFSFKGSESHLLKMQSFLNYFPPYTIHDISAGGGGADIGPLNKAVATPLAGLRPDSQRYFDYHHSPADVFSAVNRRELELGTASIATLIYLVDQSGL